MSNVYKEVTCVAHNMPYKYNKCKTIWKFDITLMFVRHFRYNFQRILHQCWGRFLGISQRKCEACDVVWDGQRNCATCSIFWFRSSKHIRRKPVLGAPGIVEIWHRLGPPKILLRIHHQYNLLRRLHLPRPARGAALSGIVINAPELRSYIIHNKG